MAHSIRYALLVLHAALEKVGMSTCRVDMVIQKVTTLLNDEIYSFKTDLRRTPQKGIEVVNPADELIPGVSPDK